MNKGFWDHYLNDCVFRYLPGIKLPENIIAVPDLIDACKDATLLIFVVPHQVSFTPFCFQLSFYYNLF